MPVVASYLVPVATLVAVTLRLASAAFASDDTIPAMVPPTEAFGVVSTTGCPWHPESISAARRGRADRSFIGLHYHCASFTAGSASGVLDRHRAVLNFPPNSSSTHFPSTRVTRPPTCVSTR